MTDFALSSVALSICVSRYTCKLGGPIHISGMAEVELSNFAHRWTILSYQKNEKSPPKRGVVIDT